MLALPKTQEPGREDPSHLVQALLGGHEIRRQCVGAGQAAVGIIASTARLHAHPAARPSYSVWL
jgi:hypothetical protein